MTSMEAFLRLYSFPIVKMSHQIYTLGVHEEHGQSIVMEEGYEQQATWKLGRNTKLMAFLNYAVMIYLRAH